MAAAEVGRDELLALVAEREDEVQRFLAWARAHEQRAAEAGKPHWSLRLENRGDIAWAAEAAELFAERWWGVVVFTAFGSRLGASTVAPVFRRPLPPDQARAELGAISLPRGAVGHHRIQPGVKGTKKALIAACAEADLFYNVLHGDGGFDGRYRSLCAARLEQWGRTTCFDLLLRAGALAVGGRRYAPGVAYLTGSTGPSAGFAAVWGRQVTPAKANWAEALLHAWTRHWHEVAEHVGVGWQERPFSSGDFENALCVYQERPR